MSAMGILSAVGAMTPMSSGIVVCRGGVVMFVAADSVLNLVHKSRHDERELDRLLLMFCSEDS